MGIKGHVAIELKNVETGKVEHIEGDNLVTNGMHELINKALLGSILYQTKSGSNDYTGYIQNYLRFSIAQKMLGGLYILKNIISPSINKTMFDANDEILSVCNNELSDDPLRGSYNSSESGATETGYKHVWDFTTSQCNFTFNTLVLSNVKDATTTLPVFSTLYDGMLANINWYGPNSSSGRVVCFNDGNYLYFFIRSTYSNPSCDLYRIPYMSTGIKLDDMHDNNFNVSNAEFVLTMDGPLSDPYILGIDEANNKFYIPKQMSSTSLIYYEINVSNPSSVSCVEKTLSLPSGSKATGLNYYKIYNNYLYYWDTSTSPAIVKKVNINDTTDIITIGEIPEFSTSEIMAATNQGIIIGSQTKFTLIKEIGGNVTFSSKSVYGFSYDYIGHGSCCTHSSYTNTAYSREQTRYIGTIYNLSSPITKTAAQTMKIIYTLTDATE